ncbi:DEAD/DEAH box helicase family protein [Bacillus smithii]|uniref:DEAD/DEAH box helicase family protein n=1 Tax=Bacillus smithii TaxID=1479 RepID=UPI003D21A96E
MRVSEVVTIDEINKWKTGDIITIKAPTGTGKSYFIKNILYAIAKKNKKRILMLIHRKNCVNQFQEEITRDKKDDVIDIWTYQYLEHTYKTNKRFDFSDYHYIVCDEFHYFMSDAQFNIFTDISLNTILQQKDCIKIMMSATGDYMTRYITNYKKLKTINYELPFSYDFIRKLTFFQKDETLDDFIHEAIETKQKAIFFIESAEKAYRLYEKYKDHCLFNCGKSNKHYKYVDEAKIHNMLKNERFDELILITTTAMDSGVNINDEDLKHIVCDVKDIGTLIQCIGRKRLQHKKDKIYLYIKTINNKQLGGIETQIKKKKEMAQFLMNHSVKEYIEKYKRQLDYSQIVYDDIVNDSDKSTKKVNDLMYFKSLIDLNEIQLIKNYGNFGYCKYIAHLFGFYNEQNGYTYRLIEEEHAKESLEEYLDSIVGKVMLQAKDRKELIEKINVKQNGKLLKSLNSLNAALSEQNFNYYIKQFETSRIINGKKKKYKNAWKVLRLVDE